MPLSADLPDAADPRLSFVDTLAAVNLLANALTFTRDAATPRPGARASFHFTPPAAA
ncbi:MAG: hypothetical protein Q7U73_15060 [Rubrivivax sp.]|nr:hypothetical protein [Rubrivivax sp.]